MPISAPDLAALGKVSLDEYMRNTPVDQIGVEHPLLKKLMAKRKLFLGAKQNVVVNIRKSYDSNFAWAYGEAQVSFNKRQTTDQAAFPWRRAVDGFYIAHDTLFGNGIKVREGDRGQYKLEQSEKVQLVNLLDEQMDAFRLGFFEKLDLELHRDGTASTDAVTGLDGLIPTAPTSGVVGGIDRATALYWRSNASTAINTGTAGALVDAMEAQWRACIRNGGAPDFILAGSDFVDAYRKTVTVTQNAESGSVKRIDAGVGTGGETGLFFKGVPIIWDPNFETLDALDAPLIPWEKRCYFLNTKFIDLRDDDMDIVTPVRPHDVLAMYHMINLRLALVLKRSNAHAVLSIA
ncbi:MAG: phage major capsid protein [Pusillimonas sp.]|nr:phage major capsid protein [Pusillimonas sp.]MBC42829.1 phage major capsid protein [Pusillimonas sp.]HCP79426.1 phage major capsid protein [Pusillimonas sp.]|tara:strand:- start:1561 stop:2607 length:1047 start_codon:yes stop_codon:yes gene_type:complete